MAWFKPEKLYLVWLSAVLFALDWNLLALFKPEGLVTSFGCPPLLFVTYDIVYLHSLDFIRTKFYAINEPPAE